MTPRMRPLARKTNSPFVRLLLAVDAVAAGVRASTSRFAVVVASVRLAMTMADLLTPSPLHAAVVVADGKKPRRLKSVAERFAAVMRGVAAAKELARS